MNFIAAVTAWAAVEITIVCGIVYLASADKPGWGWLIFLAIIVASASVTTKTEKTEKTEPPK